VSILLRVLGRHSGKASPSVRFLTLGEDLFPVRGIPGGSSPSVALGEGFPECLCPFPECIWHSGKQASPVVRVKIVPSLKINFVFMYIDGAKLPRSRGFAESFLGCSRQSLLCREFVFFFLLSGLSNATGSRSGLDSGIVC
jgi:hypothetical protein